MDALEGTERCMAYGFHGGTKDGLRDMEGALEGKGRGVLAEDVRLVLLGRLHQVLELVKASSDVPHEAPWGDAVSELGRVWDVLVKEAAKGPNPFAAWAAQKRAAQKRKDAKEGTAGPNAGAAPAPLHYSLKLKPGLVEWLKSLPPGGKLAVEFPPKDAPAGEGEGTEDRRKVKGLEVEPEEGEAGTGQTEGRP
jgi:hypothetical protein